MKELPVGTQVVQACYWRCNLQLSIGFTSGFVLEISLDASEVKVFVGDITFLFCWTVWIVPLGFKAY